VVYLNMKSIYRRYINDISLYIMRYHLFYNVLTTQYNAVEINRQHLPL
jgi:hypothetical protein